MFLLISNSSGGNDVEVATELVILQPTAMTERNVNRKSSSSERPTGRLLRRRGHEGHRPFVFSAAKMLIDYASTRIATAQY